MLLVEVYKRLVRITEMKEREKYRYVRTTTSKEFQHARQIRLKYSLT